MNKKGMTLIELLVYMAIAALLLTPIIMLMQNSSLNMARDAVNTDLRISGRDILNIMYDDIRNTGFKLKNSSGEIEPFVTYWESTPNFNPNEDPPRIDYSSFMPDDAGVDGQYDKLTIRKGRLDKDGNWEGYDEVSYYVRESDSTLIRKSTKYKYITSSPYYEQEGIDTLKEIARPVEALQFMYSADLKEDCPCPTPPCPNTPWCHHLDWEDNIYNNFPDANNSRGIKNKMEVRYIQISVVTVDKKKLSPTKTFPRTSVGNYTYGPITDSTGQYLREVSEIVVPILNNGLFPN